jgi:hypothetical protein
VSQVLRGAMADYVGVLHRKYYCTVPAFVACVCVRTMRCGSEKHNVDPTSEHKGDLKPVSLWDPDAVCQLPAARTIHHLAPGDSRPCKHSPMEALAHAILDGHRVLEAPPSWDNFPLSNVDTPTPSGQVQVRVLSATGSLVPQALFHDCFMIVPPHV